MVQRRKASGANGKASVQGPCVGNGEYSGKSWLPSLYGKPGPPPVPQNPKRSPIQQCGDGGGSPVGLPTRQRPKEHLQGCARRPRTTPSKPRPPMAVLQPRYEPHREYLGRI